MTSDTPEPTQERSRHTTEALKERIYATFTGLAIVLVQLGNVEHLHASNATITLLVGIAAISLAGFVAEILAHTVTHGAFPPRGELKSMVGIAATALLSASAPLLLLGLAWIGVLGLDVALRGGAIVYIATLGLVAWLAIHRTKLSRWKQVLALALIVMLGVCVLALQQLAHGH